MEIQTILLIFIAVALTGKASLPLINLLPLPDNYKKMLEKIAGKNGNSNGYQKQIDELTKHARTSNCEVGKIQKDIVVIKTDLREVREDLAFIKGKISNL